MALSNIAALLGAMILLAAIPSVSVLAVSTRSATFGLLHGVFTTLGIVAGDLIFITIAIWGLAFLTSAMGSLFFLVKYLGGVYLCLLGIKQCSSASKSIESQEAIKSSLSSSFMTGLLITLGDQKAILFYLGFFPAFLDISKISYLDTAIIMLVTIVAVGGVKLIYAVLANKARLLIGSKINQILNIAAGCVMVTVGIFLIAKP